MWWNYKTIKSFADKEIKVGNDKMIRKHNNMEKYFSFEELKVWQDAMSLCKNVYSGLKDCSDFGLKDQMQRTAISIPSKVAEGYEHKDSKETIHFLNIAKSLCGELLTLLYLATDLGEIKQQNGNKLIAETLDLSVKIYRYTQSLSV